MPEPVYPTRVLLRATPWWGDRVAVTRLVDTLRHLTTGDRPDAYRVRLEARLGFDSVVEGEPAVILDALEGRSIAALDLVFAGDGGLHGRIVLDGRGASGWVEALDAATARSVAATLRTQLRAQRPPGWPLASWRGRVGSGWRPTTSESDREDA